MTRIGVVGTGFMAETHLDAYADIGAAVVAVASPNTAAEFVAEQWLDAETYASADNLLAAADVDVVDVCTPTHTHREIVTAAAEADVAVFCENPISNSLDDAAERTRLEWTAFENGKTDNALASLAGSDEVLAGMDGHWSPGPISADRVTVARSSADRAAEIYSP